MCTKMAPRSSPRFLQGDGGGEVQTLQRGISIPVRQVSGKLRMIILITPICIQHANLLQFIGCCHTSRTFFFIYDMRIFMPVVLVISLYYCWGHRVPTVLNDNNTIVSSFLFKSIYNYSSKK